MKRYAIWNKKDPIITPSGEVFTAEQWMKRYPVARLANITIVCGAGEMNGSYFGTLGQMEQNYSAMGADFSNANTPEDKLAVIEEFEDRPIPQSEENTPEERIAAALELNNMMQMPVVNKDDPDA